MGPGGRGADGLAVLGGALRRSLERALHQAGIEPQVLPAGELGGGGEEARLVAQVVGGSVAGDAARVLADLDDLAAIEGAGIEGQPGKGMAVAL